MKTRTILAAVAAAIMTSSGAFADTTIAVTDVTARQRYPWNGLVDITCSVSGIDGETNGLELVVAAVMPDTGRARSASQFWVVRNGTNSTDRAVRVNGNYRLLWDAAADLGQVRVTNMGGRVTIDAHGKVRLWEGGPYWATTNIGAEKPEEYGLYFWWGDIVGYRREGGAWVASDGSSSNFSLSSGSTPAYGKTLATLQSEGWVVSKDGTYVLAPEYDAAQAQWGGGWRLPTYAELNALGNNCDWTLTERNGVNGYVVRGRGAFADACIFLPATGYGDGTSLRNAGSYGGCWSSVPYASGSEYSWCLNFYSSGPYTGYDGRYLGLPVRPVQGFTE